MESQLLNDFLAEMRRKGRALVTCAEYRCNLECFCEYLASQKLFSFFAADCSSIRSYYLAVKEKGHAACTIWRKQHAVYAFYDWLRATGRILLNPAPLPVLAKSERLPASVPSWPTLRETYQRLRDSLRFWEQRDFAMIDLAYSCGLRRAELQALDIDDVNVDEETIRVKGKGSRERLVPAGKQTLKNLLYYVYHIRPKLLKSGRTNALFVSWLGGGKRMHVGSINALFSRLRRKYGLGKSFVPHRLRHAFATDLIRHGAPVQDVSKMLGHLNLETTQIYTRLLPLDLKEHHAKYHPRS